MHVPVMANEVLEYLAVRPDGIYLDATCGLGGHTARIAERLATGRVIACDRDAESLDIARRNTETYADRIVYRQSSFSELRRTLRSMGLQAVDGLLADLGVSLYQLTAPERGFSIAASGPLDMRMDRTAGTTAAELVNTAGEKELADLIYQLGEERRSRSIARAVLRARPIRDTAHLARVIEEAVPRTSKLHPATLTFMALRRVVNREQQELDSLLDALPELVAGGGRVVAITFMSLEDRQVKEGFRRLAQSSRARLLTKHVVKPSDDEVRNNPPSRSAKLRALEMK